VVSKRKDTRKKEKKPDSFKEHEVSNSTDDDKEMRSLWATGPSTKRISRKTWRSIAIVAVTVLALILVVANRQAIGLQVSNAFQPPAVTAPVTANSTGNNAGADNKTAQVSTQAPATNPATTTPKKPDVTGSSSQTGAQTPATTPANTGVSQPEPAKDTTKPVLVEKPSAQPGDTSATIAWKTDEKSSSFLKYGTDTSYPFPSTEDVHKTTSHSIYITGLTPDTTYHYQVISSDEAGNTLISGDCTFKTESATNAAPYAGSTAPDFTLKALDGKSVSLSQFRGKKVILNFWASWCSPCKIELPHLQAVWNKYSAGGDVILLTVAGSQSDEDAIRSYVKDNNYNFTVCLDPDDSTFNRYEIVSIPKTYFIDKGGVIRRVQQGMFTSPGEVEFMLNSY
jgi:peroxiredoxin